MQDEKEKRLTDTLSAIESINEGKAIDGAPVLAWLDSWGTAQKLEPPTLDEIGPPCGKTSKKASS